MSKDLNITIPLGANTTVDEIGKMLVEKYGKNKLNEIAKLNFKNTNKIFENNKN